MNDLPLHLVLFIGAAAVIVAVSAAFSEIDDGPALQLFPRRLLYFVAGCVLLTVVMLALEHTLASVV